MSTPPTLDELRAEARSLQPEDSPDAVERTAKALESMKYTPILLIRTPGFLRFSHDQFLDELERVARMPETELSEKLPADGELDEKRREHLRLLLYHYRLLLRLRRDEPEAWDEVNELFEDD